MRLAVLVLLLVQLTGALQVSQRARRLPMQKKEIHLVSPTTYAPRLVRIDPATGKEIYYDPKPEVVLLDAPSGKYGLRWLGYDGVQKTIIYYRPDAFDAVVSASVTKRPSGEYLYTYAFENSRFSSQSVGGFAVQNFADDVRATKIAGVHVGQMSKNNEMKQGNWLRFAVLNVRQGIPPGTRVEHKLLSVARPGVVECRAHGPLGMKGIGEEPPQELENVLPGYEAWPVGYSIGPVDRLKSSTPKRRANYIRRRLAQFQRVGWIVADLVPWYEQNVRGDKMDQVFKRATTDFKEGRITSELLAIIEFNR